MPDWSYHPLLRPVLFQLPAEIARDLTLAASGALAAVPFGKMLIHIMGHMEPPDNIGVSVLGLHFNSPVGLGAGLDTNARASAAFAHFGFGFLEVGPVTLDPVETTAKVQRQSDRWAICYPDLPVNQGVERLIARLQKYGKLPVPLGIRLGCKPGLTAVEAAHERTQLIRKLTPYADFFVLDCGRELSDGLWDAIAWESHMQMLAESESARPILVNLRPDLDPEWIDAILNTALRYGIKGVVVAGGLRTDDGGRLVGLPTRDASLRLVAKLRTDYGDSLTIIASGGIGQPQDALDFLAAGADVIQLHSGFVYAGPGLPKRINEAIAYCRPTTKPAPQKPIPIYRLSWFWMTLLGAALAISGLVVWYVALTQTVLPYDEAFVGLSRAGLNDINARLLPFLTHDRVTLAGTMLSTGILYLGLALGGVRQGSRWAKNVISASAILGFLSFFLFLGFGYFDPIHALLTAGILPLYLLGVSGKMTPYTPSVQPNLTNNRRWLNGQWGQAGFVSIGFGLITAGLAITTVGILHVFVPEDLKFMDTTAEVLNAANAHLLPLIAHDRVGFGGNLVSVGAAVLLLSLWGFRQGDRWVWWTLALGGLPGFIAGIGIHISVGYLDFGHLLPALVAAILFALALILSFPYLSYPDAQNAPSPAGEPKPIPHNAFRA